MVTTEAQTTYLAQHLDTMQPEVDELQSALQGLATRCADLMVQLFTSKPRVRIVTEDGDEATAVMSRLQAPETRSAGAMTSVAQRFRGKEVTEYKPHTWSGEKGSEWFTAFRMELQKMGRITARQHDESHECRRSERRQTDGVDELRNEGSITRNNGWRQRNGQETVLGAHFMHQPRSEEVPLRALPDRKVFF